HMRSLDDSNRSLLSVRVALERHDGFGERIHYEKFVMDFVVTDVVHCARQVAGLTVNRADGWLRPIRQPGESRDLRMGHSVRNENLISFGVVSDSAWVADIQC